MKRRSFLIVLSVMAVAAARTPAFASSPQPGKLTVTGEGKSMAAPDMAIISLSVVREAETARQALSADNKAMADVIAAMKDDGVAPRDLQTGNLAIRPRYVFPNDKNKLTAPKIVGYGVTNTIIVRVRDLARLGAILDRAVSLGVNSGGGITFTNQHAKTLLDQARRDAMHDAIAKAKALTEAAGIGIGRILDIKESSNAAQPAALLRGKFAAAIEPETVPVESGENTYRVDVTVTFELKQ